MRLAGQAKLGFYPAPPEAVDAICKHLLVPPGGEGIHIIDPCCGEGLAIRQIADTLGIPHRQVYGVELDQVRGERAKENLPDANVIGRCSYHSARIGGRFSLAYVNPPFDNELGGGRREEESFVRGMTWNLAVGGVLVLVAPLMAVNGNRSFCEFLDDHYEDLQVYKFPDECRKYNEIVIIGRKRKEQLTSETRYRFGILHNAEFHFRTYGDWFKKLPAIGSGKTPTIINGRVTECRPAVAFRVPKSFRPHTFVKSNYTDEELLEDLSRSPLNLLLEQEEPIVLARPPLPPGNGHVSLLVASGMLDGVVEDAEGNAHVVRGTAKKVEYLNHSASNSREDIDTGALTTKEVYSQRVVLVIRTAWPDGEILTWSDDPEEEKPSPAKADDEALDLEAVSPAAMTAAVRGITAMIEEMANA